MLTRALSIRKRGKSSRVVPLQSRSLKSVLESLSKVNLSRPRDFWLFCLLPIEIRLKIWQLAIPLPSPRIIEPKVPYATLHGFSLLSLQQCLYPAPVLTLMHVNQEARAEILDTIMVLKFPVRVGRRRDLDASVYARFDIQSYDIERWELRGGQVINARKDILFFNKWTMRHLDKNYGKDLFGAMVVALSRIRYLALSMNSWKKHKSAWLQVLRNLEMLKEVLFVQEIGGREQHEEFGLVDLCSVATAECVFSGELWKSKILGEWESEQKNWPKWKPPKISFKGITQSLGYDITESPGK